MRYKIRHQIYFSFMRNKIRLKNIVQELNKILEVIP